MGVVYRVKDENGGHLSCPLLMRHNLVYSFDKGSTLWRIDGFGGEEIFVAKISKDTQIKFLAKDTEIISEIGKHDFVRLADFIFDYLESDKWMFDL